MILQVEDPIIERSPPLEILAVRKVRHNSTEKPPSKRQRIQHKKVATGTQSTSNVGPTMSDPEEPNKRWTARGWHAKQYFALANAAWTNFPLAEFQETHKKTRAEVWDVFMGTIRLPLMNAPGRGPGVPRGGLGEERMKDMRRLEKEAQRNLRKKDEKVRDEVEEAKKLPNKTVLCDRCKKNCAPVPATIAQAQAAVKAAIEEFNRRSDILQAMVAMEQEANHGAD